MSNNRNRTRKKRKSRSKGISLLEIVFSLTLLSIILFTAFSSYMFIMKDNKIQVYRSIAYKKCQEQLEYLLSLNITSLPSMNNTTFNVDFPDGTLNAGKIYVTDLGGGTLYEIKVEITYPGSTDIPAVTASIIAKRAKI